MRVKLKLIKPLIEGEIIEQNVCQITMKVVIKRENIETTKSISELGKECGAPNVQLPSLVVIEEKVTN